MSDLTAISYVDSSHSDCCPFNGEVPHGNVIWAAEVAGIELRGEDGIPWCCGQQLKVGTGIAGPDSVECPTCGAQMLNVLSPHVNGLMGPHPGTAIVYGVEVIDAHDDGRSMWVAKPSDSEGIS